MAIGHLVTRGYGTGTLVGVIGLVVTRGYTVGPEAEIVDSATPENRVITMQRDSRTIYVQVDIRTVTIR